MAVDLKQFTRSARLAFYHWRNGANFRFAKTTVKVPESVPFGIKKQLMRGTYEAPERMLVERHLKPALPVIELGGSLGILSSYVAQKLRAGVRYDIIEANTSIIEYCKENAVAAGGDCVVKVHNLAVAYGADTVTFHASANVHVSSLSQSTAGQSITVPASTLSDLVDRFGKPNQFTLIMDIEGAEYDVFSKDTNAFKHCELAIVEIHPRAFAENGNTVQDFMEHVREAGLSVIDQVENSYAFAKR